MQASGIPFVYLAVGAGIAIWLTGQKVGGNEALGKLASKLGRFLSYLGFLVFVVGVYAGFTGPLRIAGITLERFPFASRMEQSNDEALRYVQSNLEINRTPAVGWGGASKTLLQYSVQNNGDRGIERLVVRLSTTDGSFVDLRVNGPFPAKRTTTSLIEVPSNVSRAYFTNAKAPSGEVISAR